MFFDVTVTSSVTFVAIPLCISTLKDRLGVDRDDHTMTTLDTASQSLKGVIVFTLSAALCVGYRHLGIAVIKSGMPGVNTGARWVSCLSLQRQSC